MPNVNEAKEVTVIFSQGQLEELQRLAESQGISPADALRQALQVGSIVMRAKADGKTRVLFERDDAIEELELAS